VGLVNLPGGVVAVAEALWKLVFIKLCHNYSLFLSLLLQDRFVLIAGGKNLVLEVLNETPNNGVKRSPAL
jgi:hypothetical protein